MRAIEKFEAKQTPLVDSSAIGVCTEGKEKDLTFKTIKLVNELRVAGVSGDKLSTPHVIVLTPDTQVVVDVCKALKAKFAENRKGPEVRV